MSPGLPPGLVDMFLWEPGPVRYCLVLKYWCFAHQGTFFTLILTFIEIALKFC